MLKKNLYRNLTVFLQHGFKIENELSDGKHVNGICIFCGSFSNKLQRQKNSFYINAETKLWDCKICGLHGGYLTFFEELYKYGIVELLQNKEQLSQLSKDRFIPESVLIDHGVGYNPIINRYYIPIIDFNNKVIDIKIFNQTAKTSKELKIVSSAGGKKTLYKGLDTFNPDNNNIFLVEGEWDRMVMSYVNKELNLQAEVLAVEGATSFSKEWVYLFINKNITVIFDNDLDRNINGKIIEGAGKKGYQKLYKLLYDKVNSIKFLFWEENLQNGYDIRDLFKNLNGNCKEFFNYINTHLHDYYPSEPTKIQIETPESQVADTVISKSTSDIFKVHEVFCKYLKMPSTDLIDITLASIIGNKLSGSPIWIFLVGVSGSGKSELLMSLRKLPFVESISSLTQHTLISGMNKGVSFDPSLIPKLNNKILNIKDFTTIIGMNSVAQNEIITTLRDAFDGRCAKTFGNGRIVKYESKFGIIAGVTQIIDSFSENMSSLGERFIRYEINVDRTIKGEQEVLLKAMQNLQGKTKTIMEEDLQNVILQFFNQQFDLSYYPTEDTCQKIAALAQLTSLLRGSVLREKRSGEIACSPIIEYGTRLSEQLLKLFIGLISIYKKNIDEMSQYKKLKDVVMSTINYIYRDILAFLFVNKEPQSLESISKYLKLPEITVKKNIDNMISLGALQRIKLEKINNLGAKYLYIYTEKILELNTLTELFVS